MLLKFIFLSSILIFSSKLISDSRSNQINNSSNKGYPEKSGFPFIKRLQLPNKFKETEIAKDAVYPLTQDDFDRGSLLLENDTFGDDSVLYSADYFEGDILEDPVS